MPVVKFFGRLDLDPIFLFLDGHYVVFFALERLTIVVDNWGLRSDLENRAGKYITAPIERIA